MSSETQVKTSQGYPKELRVNFLRLQMSSLMAYAKSFNIPVADNITHEELAVMVANHFVTASVTEQTVRQRFYEKTEMMRQKEEVASHQVVEKVLPKRHSKKPKKYQDSVTYTYHTRSKDQDRDDDEYVEPMMEEKTQYCFCNGEATDEMIQCDNPNCKHKWFHYSCVGVEDPQNLPETWYCPECRQNV